MLGYAEKFYCLFTVHWRTFGHIRHSSGIGASFGSVFRNPKKWAHFAGESKTFGYSVALTPTIFIFSTIMSIFDMQYGHA